MAEKEELSTELKKIKKKYGEKFMQMSRELFPTILENEGKLYEILNTLFEGNSRSLYEDIVAERLEAKFKDYIFRQFNAEKANLYTRKIKTPYELLNEAGYDLVECTTEEEIQEFKKYYAPKEELCTFNGGRLNKCVVFFAVKKNVDEIKRENFEHPQREDEYGTSVLGIQFNKTGICTVSIKNRYNHAVTNPDATYGNDLEKIIPGLTASFEELLKEHNLELNKGKEETFKLPDYVQANDGKFYKYNIKVGDTYYCPGNIVIQDGEVKRIERPEKQILIDNFVLDLEKKTIQNYEQNTRDSFLDDLKDIDKIEITKNREKGNGIRNVVLHKKDRKTPIVIEIDKDSNIIGYINQELEYVTDRFLFNNRKLKELVLPSIKKIGNSFLYKNKALEKIDMVKVSEIGDEFLFQNEIIRNVNMPELETIGQGFLLCNKKLEKLQLSKVKIINSEFLHYNEVLKDLELPSVEKVGDNFLNENNALEKLELPSLKKVGKRFLFHNNVLQLLKLPEIETIKDDFLYCNRGVKEIDLPSLREVGNDFLHYNEDISKINLPLLQKVENGFLCSAKNLKKLELPSLEEVGSNFLYYNEEVENINVINLKKAGNNFLYHNKKLQELNIPNVNNIGYCLLYENTCLKKLSLPNLEDISYTFEEDLKNKKDLFELNLPQKYRNIANNIVARNNKKAQQGKISSRDIAILDKENGLLTSTINWAKRMINKILYREEKNKEEHDNR